MREFFIPSVAEINCDHPPHEKQILNVHACSTICAHARDIFRPADGAGSTRNPRCGASYRLQFGPQLSFFNPRAASSVATKVNRRADEQATAKFPLPTSQNTANQSRSCALVAMPALFPCYG